MCDIFLSKDIYIWSSVKQHHQIRVVTNNNQHFPKLGLEIKFFKNTYKTKYRVYDHKNRKENINNY